jgi:RimJ/RimL family protein N-acetyltransferase
LAILDIGFIVLCLPEIVAVISRQNKPSQRLAEELGFSVWKETRWSGQPRRMYRARP